MSSPPSSASPASPRSPPSTSAVQTVPILRSAVVRTAKKMRRLFPALADQISAFLQSNRKAIPLTKGPDNLEPTDDGKQVENDK